MNVENYQGEKGERRRKHHLSSRIRILKDYSGMWMGIVGAVQED